METLPYLDKISFNFINKRPRINQSAVKSWLSKILTDNKYSLLSISYNFCSDAILLEINQEYLSHDYLTDIITFDLSDIENSIEGDIYISIDRIKDNAKTLQVEYEVELLRVMAHGLLHLMGQDDKTKKDKEQMRIKEDSYLAMYKNHVPRETEG
jgi:rRNA maturation RNase YbeY